MYTTLSSLRPPSLARGAEDDVVVGTRRADEGAGHVVLGVAVRVRAEPLEEPRVVGRATAVGHRADAAIDVPLEHWAHVVARVVLPRLGGAARRDVHGAARAAAAPEGVRQESHGHVEAVNVGGVEEVKVVELVERELGQRVGCPAVARALQPMWRLSLPLPSKRHPVRAQMRAAVVPGGTLMLLFLVRAIFGISHFEKRINRKGKEMRKWGPHVGWSYEDIRLEILSPTQSLSSSAASSAGVRASGHEVGGEGWPKLFGPVARTDSPLEKVAPSLLFTPKSK